MTLRLDENAWHGACLAIAELSRRGLLLPSRLSEVVRGVEQAVVYDQRKGSHSVGSHVRDAACYVFWAFCRAYSPSVLLPYVKSIASSLLTSAVYDREVSCRRAAAAAFQECVGRQGDAFPHGIDIITTADYFTLSNIHVAYLDVAPFVARYFSALWFFPLSFELLCLYFFWVFFIMMHLIILLIMILG